jgi:hypothetical protein
MTARGYTPPTSLVAPPQAELAYRQIDLSNRQDRAYLDSMTTGIAFNQAQKSWKNYREVGEVRYSVARSAKIAGYSTLFGQKIGNSGNETGRASDASVVAEIVAGITSRFGGTRGLIERFYTLRKVTGETYLTAFRDSPGQPVDGYWFLSPSEIGYRDTFLSGEPSTNLRWTTARIGSVSGEGNVFTREITPEDFRGRIWAPDGEYLDNPDSPMNAINDLCEMLKRVEQSIMGRLKSRFAMNGILFIPTEINDAAISGDLPGSVDYGTNDKVLRYIIHIMTRNLMDLDKATGAFPILMKGPAAVSEAVRHIINESMVSDTDLQLRSALINQILDGLDQQRGQVQDEKTDRFSAWTRSDQERRITVQPDLEEMCHAVTRLILWRELKQRGWNDARIRPWRVWYDLSAAAVKANLADEARQAFDRGVVNAAYLRKATGASDLDVMDPSEYVRWVGTKTQDPYLMLYGIEEIEIDWAKVGIAGKQTGPSPDNAGESDPQSNPGQGDPGSPGDRSVDDQTPDDES